MGDSGSRKSMHLQPVMIMPGSVTDQERFSEFSHRSGRSHKSGIPQTNGYHPSNFSNFQL
jgi:LHFPL tetraspan subfamily member protein